MLKGIDASSIANTQYSDTAIKNLEHKFKDELEKRSKQIKEQDAERKAPRKTPRNEPIKISSSSNTYNESDKMGIK